MTMLDSKQLLRDGLIGFAVGLVLMLGVSYGLGTASAQQAPSAAIAE